MGQGAVKARVGPQAQNCRKWNAITVLDLK